MRDGDVKTVPPGRSPALTTARASLPLGREQTTQQRGDRQAADGAGTRADALLSSSSANVAGARPVVVRGRLYGSQRERWREQKRRQRARQKAAQGRESQREEWRGAKRLPRDRQRTEARGGAASMNERAVSEIAACAADCKAPDRDAAHRHVAVDGCIVWGTPVVTVKTEDASMGTGPSPLRDVPTVVADCLGADQIRERWEQRAGGPDPARADDGEAAAVLANFAMASVLSTLRDRVHARAVRQRRQWREQKRRQRARRRAEEGRAPGRAAGTSAGKCGAALEGTRTRHGMLCDPRRQQEREGGRREREGRTGPKAPAAGVGVSGVAVKAESCALREKFREWQRQIWREQKRRQRERRRGEQEPRAAKAGAGLVEAHTPTAHKRLYDSQRQQWREQKRRQRERRRARQREGATGTVASSRAVQCRSEHPVCRTFHAVCSLCGQCGKCGCGPMGAGIPFPACTQ
ncbi:unnamed protein product [Ostreobium quekettii]|uniref:Uncharacterized protein n=1 Tax=Ostreobium quekettii TaxID=121088 RepID=A0A8S1IMJ8_9CHLO|nr:unnamed protein product [Ostreobium quekettii]|eukprot:evm.model.scf_112.4 EVM.evm.TU.scf_112.4   scf_112:26819-28213(-)